MDSEFWMIIWHTVCVSGTAIVVSALLGVPFGIFCGLSDFPGKSVVRTLIYTGMGLPPVVVGLVLYLLLSRSGPLASLGWLFTMQAMIVAQTILAFPFVTGITMTAVSAVPPELIQQIRTLGASPSQVSWTILHEAKQGVTLAVLAAFGRSISEVGAVLIVGGNIQGHTRVLTTAIVLETSKGDFLNALALGAFLLVMALTVNALVIFFHRRGLPT